MIKDECSLEQEKVILQEFVVIKTNDIINTFLLHYTLDWVDIDREISKDFWSHEMTYK